MNLSLLETALASVVSAVVRSDPLLARIETRLLELEVSARESPPAPLDGRPDLGGVRDRLSEGVDPGAPFRDLSPPAHRRAIELLGDLRRETIEKHAELAPLRPLLREVHRAAEALVYAQILEAASFEDGPPFLYLAGWSAGEDRQPYRLSIRRERGGDGELGLRMIVESRRLGRVGVEGRLAGATEGRPSGRLRLVFRADQDRTRSALRDELPRLVEVLEERGYQPDASVRAGSPVSDAPASRASTHLDVKG